MDSKILVFQDLLRETLPGCHIELDEPDRPTGNYWVDITVGKKDKTVEYRPARGFGLYSDDAGFGEGPAEVYSTPEEVVQRLAHLFAPKKRKSRQSLAKV